MSFTAIIPVASMAAANAFLENVDGEPGRGSWGPNNFSVPAYAGSSPTHALFHSWDIPGFIDDVVQIAGVVILDSSTIDPESAIVDTPIGITTEVAESVGATWGQAAKPLVGVVTPGLYTHEDTYWWVLQQYNADQWSDPLAVPALVLPARTPGVAAAWVQPGANNGYKLLDPFTGLPETCIHNGKTWKVSQADGAGNNVWEPGVFGWVETTNN